MTALALTLLAWAGAWWALIRATRPRRAPMWASELAYRQGRQCYTGIYGPFGGPPERCVYPEDHYGECKP